MIEEDSDLSSSHAFKEYAHGRSKKVPFPWVTIVVSGVLVAIAMVVTNVLATALYNNPYAFNFILALYGIPAGFVCALRNENLSAITSLKFSSFSAGFATAAYFLISLIIFLANPNDSVGYINGIVQLILGSLLIAVFFVCVTFAIGAVLGTFFTGVRDAKK